MPRFLVQASYTADAIAALVSKPRDRTAGVRAAIEQLGGYVESLDFSLGEYDVVGSVTLPDDTTVMAINLTSVASRTARAYKTTKLLTPEEFLAAQQQAHGTSYQAPTRA